MNLPFFKKNPPAEKREYLFALEIGYESVKSAIWTVANDRSQVLAFGSTVRCQTDNEDNLIPACDQTLSQAAANLDASGRIQPEKMILGLPSAWVNDDKISPDKLHLLKNLTKKLSLSAIGFVVTPQALVKYLQFTENVPPNAILIGFWENSIEVTLVRLGKIAATQLVRKSHQLTADVVEGLTRFGHVDMLPSRILIYDSGTGLEDIKQELLGFAWQAPQNRLPFLHFPKIEILPSDFSVKAISLAGGSEVAQALGLITKPPVAPDIQAPDELPREEIPAADLSPEELGFSTDGIEASEIEAALPSETPAEAEIVTRPKFKLPAFSFKFKLPSFHLSLPQISGSSGLILGLVGLLAVAGGLFAAYWYLPRATVVITVTPKSLQHSFDLTADSTVAAVDLTQSILPALGVSADVTGHLAKAASGSKIIGDKATGSVSVINGTPAARSFPAGTQITSPDGLVYTFDSSVTVASASGTADPNSYQPGKATVNVTSRDIGVDKNLSAGTQFRIGSFSTLDYVAKNDTAFTGGSSRQVAAVAAQDLTDLRSQLTASLTDQAKTKLTGSLSAGHQLIAESVKVTSVSEKFDHAVGDVADNLGLDLALRATGLSFNTADLDNLITGQISSLIPPGFQQEDGINHTFTIKSVKDSQAVITVQVTAVLTPQLENTELLKNISGKSVTAAKNYLQNYPGVSQIDFKFIPPLPSGLLTLPHVPKNIGVVLKTAN
jgi:hypothetical protein